MWYVRSIFFTFSIVTVGKFDLDILSDPRPHFDAFKKIFPHLWIFGFNYFLNYWADCAKTFWKFHAISIMNFMHNYFFNIFTSISSIILYISTKVTLSFSFRLVKIRHSKVFFLISCVYFKPLLPCHKRVEYIIYVTTYHLLSLLCV